MTALVRTRALYIGLLLALSVLMGMIGAISASGLEEAGADLGHPMLVPPQDPSVAGWEPAYPLEAPAAGSRGGRAIGTEEVIVVPVEFQDVTHDPKNNVTDLWNRTFSLAQGQRSMNTYYNEVSQGLLNLTGDVGPWVQSANNLSWYGADGQGNYPDDGNGPIWRLVIEAVQLADPFIDFSQFDENGDGEVDNIIVVHAGQGQEALGGSENDIWSHHWAVGQSLVADGVRIYTYSMVSEHSPIGTWAHEFGHELGLPDLYDIDGSSYGIGKWGIMGSGSWNGGGNYPAHMCAWSKVRLGWADPIDILAPMANMTLAQVETGGDIYRLWVGDPDTSTEYFLLENRQKVGYDQNLPGAGLLIWHVDERQTSNTDDDHRLVDLEEADEEASGDKPFHSGDPWSDSLSGFNQFSIPSSNGYNGLPSGWAVEGIGPSGSNMTISIDIIADDVGIPFLMFKRYVNENEPVDITAFVFNYGINDQTDVVVLVSVTQGSSVVDITNKTVPSIPSKDSRTVTVTFTPQDQGNYLISAKVLLAKDQLPENDEAIEVLHVTSIIFMDDVEGGVNGWDHSGSSPPSDLWRIIDDGADPSQSNSPHHSWFCGVQQLGGGGYVPFSEYYLERTIEVPLVREGFLIFSQRYDLAFSVQNQSIARSDTAYIEIRTNVDTFFWELDMFEGTSGGWGTRIYKISSYLENPLVKNITIRFRLETSLLMYGKGWWVDDILFVGQWFEHDLAVLLDEDMIAVGPGETGTVTVTVWNSGSEPDIYLLSTLTPPFWNASLPGDEISVQPMMYKRFTLTITAPKKALADEETTIGVEVTSKGDSSVSRQADLVVIVKRTYGLEVDTGPSVLLRPGIAETVTINITNEGNAKETVHLNLTGTAAEWAIVELLDIVLDPFETEEIEVVLQVPFASREGDAADLKVRAYTTVGVEDSDTLQIRFGRIYGLMLVPVVHELTATPGEEVYLEFEVVNRGNGKDTIVLLYGLPPSWKVEGNTRVALGPWENVTVYLTVTVPETSPLSDFKVKVRADSSDGETYEELDLKVRVVLPDPAVRSLRLSKTYVTGEENITIAVMVANDGTGTARDIYIGLYDNGRNFRTLMIEELEGGRSEEFMISYRFKDGHHDIAVVLTYEGSQADTTNDEAHEDLKVMDQPAFIPGAWPVLAIAAVPAAMTILSGSRKYGRH